MYWQPKKIPKKKDPQSKKVQALIRCESIKKLTIKVFHKPRWVYCLGRVGTPYTR